MSEILLQTIVEKLEAIELLLKVKDKGKKKGTDIAPIKMELDALEKKLRPLLLF